jgi:hypothetical protein
MLKVATLRVLKEWLKGRNFILCKKLSLTWAPHNVVIVHQVFCLWLRNF